jgi:hypothetical protein
MGRNFAAEFNAAMAKMEAVAASAGAISNSAQAEDFQRALQVEVEAMERIHDEWRAQSLADAGLSAPPPDGKVLVELTPRQRALVRDETGLEMDVVELPGSGVPWLQTMPNAVPEMLDRVILQVARERVGRKRAVEEIQAMLDELERSDNPALAERIAELRHDPDFLAGVLQDKGR